MRGRWGRPGRGGRWGRQNAAIQARSSSASAFEPIPPLDGVAAPTSAFSVSRKMLSSFTGAYYTASAGAVSQLTDQSGNARHLVQASGPLKPTIASKYGYVGLDFAAVGSQLAGPNLSEFIASTSGYMVVSFVHRGISQDSQNGNRIISDAALGGNIVARSTGSLSYVFALQYDGAYENTPDQLINIGSQYVVAFRKDATKMYCQVNNTAEVEVPQGALTAMAYALNMGGTAPNNHNGYIFEFATWSTMPSLGDRNTIMSEFMRHIGIPETAPDLSGFPSAATTGYAPGSVLVDNAGGTISTPGIIENFNFSGTLTIDVNGVTVRNCKFNVGAYYGVRVSDGITATVENCEFDGTGGAVSGTAIYGKGTFTGNNIHHVENGINLIGPNCVVTGNYIHDLSGVGEAHYDCIECNGGESGTVIANNTLLCPSQTAAVNINNTFAGQDGILVHDNYMAGGTYTVYVAGDDAPALPITNIRVYDNFIGKGQFGYFNLQFAPDTYIANNRDATTGLQLAES